MTSDVEEAPLPTPCLVVLIGPPASGKSTWAAENFRPEQVVSSDQLRAVVGEHELDLAATNDAFELLDAIVAKRLSRRLTTVIDTTGLDEARRRSYLQLATGAGVPAVAVRFTTSAAECKRRNRERRHPVPVRAIDQMVAKAKVLDLSGEGWHRVIEPRPVRAVTAKLQPSVDEAVVGNSAIDEEAVDEANVAGSMTGRQLRVGLMISSFDWEGGAESIGATLRRIASEAEEAGVDSLWVMDHLVQIPQIGRGWDPMLEAYSTLAHLAAVTERIRLGVLVSPVTFRHVAMLAKTIATLDVLSGGRAVVGLGAGSSPNEHDDLGVHFGSSGERLDRLEDTVAALRALLGPGGKPFERRSIRLPSTGLYPRPLQERVPIIVGGSGERRTLRIAAELGDGCNLFGDLATVERKISVLHEHCRAVGRDPAAVEITHLGTALVGVDAADLRGRVEALRPSNLGPDRFAERVNAGTAADHASRLAAFEAAGVSTVMIDLPGLGRPGAIEPMAELVRRMRS